MIKPTITGLLFFILLFPEAHSQCDTLTVFHVSGRAFINQDSTTHDIAKGESLYRANIMLKEHSQVILFNRSGVSIILDKPGYYSFEEIQEMCQQPKKSLLSRYLSFVWDGLTEKKTDGNQKIQAAITRGEEFLMKYPFDSPIIISPKILFSWRSIPEHPVYTFEIRDASNRKVIVKTIESDTTFLWQLDSSLLATSGYYTWVVSAEPRIPDNMMRFTFEIVDEACKEEFHQKLTKFQKELVFDEPLNSLILAKFYEENYLYDEAFQLYKKIINEYPDQQEAMELYNRFLENVSPSQ